MMSDRQYAEWFCEQIEKDNSFGVEPCTMKPAYYSCIICPRLSGQCIETVENRRIRYRYFKGVRDGSA